MGQRTEGPVRLGYRPDVDGLRALAVGLVLADHLGTRLSGGYIGVDVFFVISGYLISATILAEMRAGRFSIGAFYERRVRRIFPAMLVLMAVVTVLVYRFFAPLEVLAYGRSLLAALFSGSNFLFWHEAGYFDAPSALKPLLHTWSLGVEEQFYLLFPLFLVLVRRWFPARMKAAILGVALVSFAAACGTVLYHPDAAFFLAPLRAWELLAGTLVSQRYVPVPRSAAGRNVASAAGLLLIVAPALLYGQKVLFPGPGALPPVLGAALVIAGGETGSSWVGRLLAWRPVVFVGLISYSLYLWHWPLIVLQVTSSIFFQGSMAGHGAKVLLAGVSVGIATVSWAFVEQPFRKGRFRPGRRAVLLSNGAVVGLLGAIGIWMVRSQGIPGRFPPEALAIADYGSDGTHPGYREGVCMIGTGSTLADFRPDECLAQTEGRRSLLIVGDSHGAQLYPGMAAVFRDRDVLQANTTGCRPMVKQGSGPLDAGCRQFYGFLYGDFLLHHHVDTVVLAGRWEEDDFAGLGETIAFLRAHGINVVVVGPSIEYDMPQPRVIAIALRDGKPGEVAAHRSALPAATDRRMAELARTTWHVPYISIYDDLCGAGCPVYGAPGVPLLFDTDHLTVEGSTMLARAMRDRGQIPQ